MENKNNNTLLLISTWAGILQFVISFFTYINYFPFHFGNDSIIYFKDKNTIVINLDPNSATKNDNYASVQLDSLSTNTQSKLIKEMPSIKEFIKNPLKFHIDTENLKRLMEKNSFLYFWLPFMSFLLFLVSFIGLLFYSIEIFSHGSINDIMCWLFFFILDIIIIITILNFTDII